MITNEQEDGAKDKLKEFLSDTLSFLKSLVDDRTNYFPTELASKIEQAWTEFEVDFASENAPAKIDAMSGETLQLHGLYGRQLDLKLSIIDFWRTRFTSLTIVDEQIKKILKRLLETIDALLESLLAAAGIKEAVKEMKECLKNLLDLD